MKQEKDLGHTRIIGFPRFGISYIESFYSAIEAQGGEVIEGDASARWLLEYVRSSDVIHLHWPSFLYETSKPTLSGALRSFFRFIVLLAIMRLKAKKIFWTVHNLLPHTRSIMPILDVLGRHLVISIASNVFIHGEEAKAVLIKRFPRANSKCVNIPFGNWIGHYKPVQTRKSGRESLNLPRDAFVYLLFGQCKPYKNIKSLVEIFRKNATDDDYLLIAGSFSDEEYHSEILKAVGNDPKIRIDSRFIPDDKVSCYLSSADVMCIPYREVLTSGTAMLAISFGKPVLSINRGFLRDIVTEGVGLLIEPSDELQLRDGLKLIKQRSWNGEFIRSHASNYTFENAARIFIEKI